MPTALTRGEAGPGARIFSMLGHLRPGLTMKAAEPDVQIIAQRLAKVYPKDYPKHFTGRLRSLIDNVIGQFRATLYTLLAAVGLLLLIGCGNVANLLLAREANRQKELAGVVYRMTPNGEYTVVHQFSDDERVSTALMQASNGLIYGGYYGFPLCTISALYFIQCIWPFFV